jgi:hypothetical protein
MTAALGTLSMPARLNICNQVRANHAALEEELAALPIPADGYADGGEPFPAQPVYTDQEIAWMRQEVMQRFMDSAASLNVAHRLFA